MDADATFQSLAAELVQQPDVKLTPMFGVPSLTYRRKVFAVFQDQGMVFRLGRVELEQALQIPGAKLWQPQNNGKVMRGWVYVPAEQSQHWSGLSTLAITYVSGLISK